MTKIAWFVVIVVNVVRGFFYHDCHAPRLPRFLISIFALLLITSCSYMPSWMGGESQEEESKRAPGERQTVLPPAPAFTPDSAAAASVFSLPRTVDNLSWPQHTGLFTAATGNITFTGTLTQETSAEIGSGEAFDRPLIPRPVVEDGVVFAMDAVGIISAHDATNIDTIKWQSAGVSEDDEPNVLGGGLAVSDGKLFATSGRGLIAAFDAATGKELWKKSLRTPLKSAPAVAGGKLFVITGDSQLFALDIASGEALWAHRGIAETASLMNAVSPTVSGGDVIVPYASGEIHSLSAGDGNTLWSESLAAPGRTLASANFSGIGGDPVVDGDFVFAVSSGGKLGVFALATGQKIWEKPVSAINTPWISGDYLFVLTADNSVICFVKYTGAVRWAVKLPAYENEKKKEDPILWRGPVLLNGVLAIVGSHGEMKLLNAADGNVLDTKEIPEGIVTAPVVAGGRMFLVGQDATLYSLQ